MRNPLVHLVLAIVLLIGVAGLYEVWYVSVGKASARSAGLATQIAAESQSATRVAAAKVALASLSADEMQVNQYLIQTNDVVPFLSGLEKTGKDLGATVEVVSVAADSSTVPGHLTLALKVSGSFDSVLRTVGSIEYGPYDAVLKSMTLDTVATDAKAPAQWTAATVFNIGTQGPATTPPVQTP